jgi:hypothetical protein
MVANGDADTAKEIQEEWVHCLGNLTLTGYNSKLSDKAFEQKHSKEILIDSRNIFIAIWEAAHGHRRGNKRAFGSLSHREQPK